MIDPAEKRSSTPPLDKHHSLILFDGVCNFCNSSVNFLLDRDPEGRFLFGALQDEAARPYLVKHGLEEQVEKLDSLVLIEGGRCFTRSTAALRIAKRLPYPWRLLSVFLIVPAPIRDFFYRVLARNRYRWFGKKEACRIPSDEEKSRFIG